MKSCERFCHLNTNTDVTALLLIWLYAATYFLYLCQTVSLSTRCEDDKSSHALSVLDVYYRYSYNCVTLTKIRCSFLHVLCIIGTIHACHVSLVMGCVHFDRSCLVVTHVLCATGVMLVTMTTRCASHVTVTTTARSTMCVRWAVGSAHVCPTSQA